MTLNAGAITTGEREIDPEQTAGVERIFRDFVAGVSPEAIVKALNREGIAGPFGGSWSPSMLGATVQTKRSPESDDLSLQVVMVAGARNTLNLEFSWAAA